VTDKLPPGPNHRWGLTLSDVGASCDKDASPRALLGERELPVRTSIEAGGQYDVLILCQLLKGEQIRHCQCVQETCLAGQSQKNVLLSADLRPVYQELILEAESSAPGSQPEACKAFCPSFNDDIALSLRPDFEAGRGDKDRWVIDSSDPGFVEEPVFDKDFTEIASLETNPGFLGPSPSPRSSASGILLTAQTVGSGSGWNRADELLYVINPITPQYESNESKEVETCKKRRMITDFRAYNEGMRKPDEQAFIYPRLRSAGGWIDREEPFNDPWIRKDDPRREVRFDEDRVEVHKHEAKRYDSECRALTNSVGRICKHHLVYCRLYSWAIRLVLVVICLFCAELG
jgi:hypothetical protein